jgi:hypothetical protein
MNDVLSTRLSDQLVRRLRDYLDFEADMMTGGNDPAQEAEPNTALVLLRELDAATDGEFRQNDSRSVRSLRGLKR